MGDHERRDLSVTEYLEHDLAKLAAKNAVKPRKRFVEQHEAGLAPQRPGERNPLLLTAAKRVGHRFGIFGETDLTQYEKRRIAALRPLLPHPEHYVAQHREMRKQRVVLKDVAHATPLGRDVSAWVIGVANDLAVDRDGAGVGVFEAGDQSKQRGFAAPRLAQQAVHLSASQLQRDVVYHAAERSVREREAVDLDRVVPRVARGRPSRCVGVWVVRRGRS